MYTISDFIIFLNTFHTRALKMHCVFLGVNRKYTLLHKRLRIYDDIAKFVATQQKTYLMLNAVCCSSFNCMSLWLAYGQSFKPEILNIDLWTLEIETYCKIWLISLTFSTYSHVFTKLTHKNAYSGCLLYINLKEL